MAVKPTYGCRLVVLTELNADGSEKIGGKTVRIDTPQQVSFEPQITEGQNQELRGGDGLVAKIEEDDVLTGMNATFQDAVLNYEAMQLLAGGTLVGTAPDYTGYTPPTTAEQKANPTPPVKAEIYYAEYAEGSQLLSGMTGYQKVTLWFCKGTIPSWTQQDRNFGVPSYTLKSRENQAQNKPAFTIEDVATLPA